ncbi:MAG: accessory gene regulator B family protein [Alistipes sp.]|nr:accessory gene regulator B family protein [Alistipes sp.]
MMKYIQEKFEFTDYQMAQLRYFFLTFFGELSKLLILGFLFRKNLPVFIWAVFILHLTRSSLGGIHCKTYWGCFLMSLIYLTLAIEILPRIPVNKFYQMAGLLVCIVLSHHIGPVTSRLHPVLPERVCSRLKIKIITILFIYYILLYIMPESQYITVGFWVIILNTLQLTIARMMKPSELQVKGGAT